MVAHTIRGGEVIDIPSAEETAAAVDAKHRAFWHEQQDIESARHRERVRAIKYMRLPVLRGTPASNALTIGGASSADIIGPAMGYAWVMRHLWINGLASGATPDAMNILVNNQTWWQLNGNSFAETWGKGQIVLLQGESMTFQNSGSLTATGQISVGGAYWELPGEMLAELT